MNIIQITKSFGTQNRCIEFLEKLRWGNTPTCPYCGSTRNVALKVEKHRYSCYDCRRSFSVTVGTIFEETQLPLPKWFVIVGLMTNAKRGISAKEIERYVGLTYKTAWYSAMRVRCAMIDKCNIELDNTVEMDEAYVGGKPRHGKIACGKGSKQVVSASGITTTKYKRGRGTCQTPIVGIVERKGKIVVKVIEKLSYVNLSSMLKKFVKTETATVMTDEFRSYNGFDDIVEHYTVHHKQKEYVRGDVHTNTIEGFWSIVKNSIKGNYIKISKKYLPFYLVQAQYMFNHRNYTGDLFTKFLKEALEVDKSAYMENYKPIRNVKKLVYKRCKTKK